MIIEGIVRTKSKIHVTSALDDSTKINPAGQINAPDARIPLSRTYRTAAFTSRGRVEIPFFPANSLVGRMRRVATGLIAKSLTERGEQMSRTTYRGVSCGAADSSPEMGGLLVDEFEAYLKHPYIGLFGGGKRLYESAYKFFDMIPVMEATVESGMIPADYADQMVMLNSGDSARAASRITGIDVIHRRDDLMDGASEEIVASISDYADLYEDMKQEAVRKAQAAAARAGVKPADDEKKESRASMSQQSAREYISPGVPLYFKAALKQRITDEQMGLFLICLLEVFNSNEFGGVSHLGYGELNLSDVANNLTLHGKTQSSPLFSVAMVSGRETLSLEHPEAIDCVSKALHWIGGVINKDLESFYTASAEPKEKKPSKKEANKEEISASEEA